MVAAIQEALCCCLQLAGCWSGQILTANNQGDKHALSARPVPAAVQDDRGKPSPCRGAHLTIASTADHAGAAGETPGCPAAVAAQAGAMQAPPSAAAGGGGAGGGLHGRGCGRSVPGKPRWHPHRAAIAHPKIQMPVPLLADRSAHALQVLGVPRSADSTTVQRAYKKKLSEVKGDEAATQRIEAAHTSIMMGALTSRLKVRERARAAAISAEVPVVNSQPPRPPLLARRPPPPPTTHHPQTGAPPGTRFQAPCPHRPPPTDSPSTQMPLPAGRRQGGQVHPVCRQGPLLPLAAAALPRAQQAGAVPGHCSGAVKLSCLCPWLAVGCHAGDWAVGGDESGHLCRDWLAGTPVAERPLQLVQLE